MWLPTWVTPKPIPPIPSRTRIISSVALSLRHYSRYSTSPMSTASSLLSRQSPSLTKNLPLSCCLLYTQQERRQTFSASRRRPFGRFFRDLGGRRGSGGSGDHGDSGDSGGTPSSAPSGIPRGPSKRGRLGRPIDPQQPATKARAPWEQRSSRRRRRRLRRLHHQWR